ncbi:MULTISPECIES: uracil phosphoribosyltransferase [Clostridium]|uniref:Uracil phosphoribosyltransferase n=1 Tax=Clostridium paridis TaxID=2803863 RepID=A0A937FJ63_9CLOT|nr:MULTISPECIES: uracil phosphoribosyltransferase [Clostridium]MBL4932686.1 uracil phosphoribosyltransferase [Clostridium paridis]MDD7792690.1 uracil phosphoribosyltransferase [Clostridium sp. 'White wine YQ']
MSKVTQINHPLIQHKLALIRSKDTGSKDFRELVEEVSMLMAYEVTRDLQTEFVEIETPICKTKHQVLSGKKLAVVPILRAGLGMVDGMLKLIPAAKVGHIGLYRDEETLKPVEYFCKLPQDIAERDIMVVDPMLATGGSAADALTLLKEKGARSLKLVCLISAPEGIKYVQEAHPDVDIYVSSIDERLNENGYIVPGLGDAGDRLFGTK